MRVLPPGPVFGDCGRRAPATSCFGPVLRGVRRAGIVVEDRGEDHRASGRSCVVLSAEPGPYLRPMARPAPALYGDRVVSNAVRSFLAEPPAPHPPAPLRRDWVLVA